MTPEQQAAYVQSCAVAALIEMQAMIVANKEREDQGLALAYDEKAFFDLLETSHVGHNAVIGFYQSNS